MKLGDLMNTLDEALKVTIFANTDNCPNDYMTEMLFNDELGRLPWGYAKFKVKHVWIADDEVLGISLASTVDPDYFK